MAGLMGLLTEFSLCSDLCLLNHSYHKLKIQLQDLVARKMLQYKLLIPSEQNWKFKSSSNFCKKKIYKKSTKNQRTQFKLKKLLHLTLES